jgi:hypothetical protein
MAIGTVTLKSPRIVHYYGNPNSIDFEDVQAITFPPENIILSDKGSHELTPKNIQSELRYARNRKHWDDGMVAKMTGKSKELQENFDKALEAKKSTTASYDITKITWGGEQEFLFPIAHKKLQIALNIARAGYDVTLEFDQTKDDWASQVVPLARYTRQLSQPPTQKLKL